MPCKLPTHRSGSVGMESERAYCIGILFSSGFASKAGLPGSVSGNSASGKAGSAGAAAAHRSTRELESAPDGTTVRECSCGAVQHTGCHSLGIPATFSFRNIMCQEFWGFFLTPQISGFEGFVNFWLNFVIKSTFRRRRLMHHQQKHFRELDVFHDRTFARFALDFGASTGAGLLKAEGMLYFSQS